MSVARLYHVSYLVRLSLPKVRYQSLPVPLDNLDDGRGARLGRHLPGFRSRGVLCSLSDDPRSPLLVFGDDVEVLDSDYNAMYGWSELVEHEVRKVGSGHPVAVDPALSIVREGHSNGVSHNLGVRGELLCQRRLRGGVVGLEEHPSKEVVHEARGGQCGHAAGQWAC